MGWVYLMVAGAMEWGWPMGLKFALRDGRISLLPGVLAVVSMLASGLFLLLALRTIPVGTAYAVWTGIGAVGTFLLGIAFLGEPATLARCLCVDLIVDGIIGLKLAG